MTPRVDLDDVTERAIAASVASLVEDRVASRLFAGDATLWGPGAAPEAAERLGWTNFTDNADALIPEILRTRDELRAAGIDRIVLCGMGGSSLAPEVIGRWAGVSLSVLDSTHPVQVRREIAGPLERTAVVISSKSGTTIDTRSHDAAFAAAFAAAGLPLSQHMLVVTDPGTELGELARNEGRRVFEADPRVGGRYSALTAFGLVPTGLAGADIATLVAAATRARRTLCLDDPENPALRLAAALAVGLPEQYIIAVRESAGASWGLGPWVEQLIAESTGKSGRGILPVALHHDSYEEREGYPPSTQLVRVNGSGGEADPGSHITVSADLGEQFLLWEAATAILGRLIGINPFDQPDVESAKSAARAILDAPDPLPSAHAPLEDLPGARLIAAAGREIHSARDLVSAVERFAVPDRYVSLQVYLDRETPAGRGLAALRDEMAQRLGIPVSLDFGPRFLHSTGQCHKGGPAKGIFLQVLDEAQPELIIPGSDLRFGELITAQAHGDREVLEAHGFPVISVQAADTASLVAALTAAFADTAGHLDAVRGEVMPVECNSRNEPREVSREK